MDVHRMDMIEVIMDYPRSQRIRDVMRQESQLVHFAQNRFNPFSFTEYGEKV
jgi:hypothetical protein